MCSARDCHWCLYTTTCLPHKADCTEDCATDNIYMSCAERNGIIVTSVFLGILIIVLAWFVQRQYWELQENITWRLLHNHSELGLADGFPDTLDVNAEYSGCVSDVSETADEKQSLLSGHPVRKQRSRREVRSRSQVRQHRRQYERELEQKHTILKNPDTLASFF